MSVDVVMKMPELPEAWEYTGEYRVPVTGELYSPKPWVVVEWRSDFQEQVPYPIVRRVEKWRPATIEDAVRAIRGEEVIARFRENYHDWRAPSRLCGYRTIPGCQWFEANGCGWSLCEVLECN